MSVTTNNMPSSRAGPGGKEAETERAKGDRSGVAAVTSTPAPAQAQPQPPPPLRTCAMGARRALYRVEDLEDVYGGIFFGGAADLAPY